MLCINVFLVHLLLYDVIALSSTELLNQLHWLPIEW